MKSSAPDPGTAASPRQSITRKLRALIRPDKKKGHRLAADVTGEDDWEVDEPQIRMSRAFAVMLVLHLVAVGGLFAFHMFGRDDREAEGIATGQAHAASPPPPSAPRAAAAAVPAPEAAAPAGTAPPSGPAAAAAAALVSSAPVPPRAELVEDDAVTPDGGDTHVFKTGESKMLVAAKYGVSVRELEEANPQAGFKAGDSLVIPRRGGRVIGALADTSKPANPPLALLEASSSEDVGHREFALKKGDENPYAPVAPEELEAVSVEPPPARARPVKAEPGISVIHQNEDSDAGDQPRPSPAAAKSARKPVPAPAAESAAVSKPKSKPATGSRTHVVQKGDTVYNVARRYGLSPAEVMRANNISDPARMQLGQVLKITVKR